MQKQPVTMIALIDGNDETHGKTSRMAEGYFDQYQPLR